ncbi:hypothetical protein SAY86_027794 [Trapa natans]|uniref:Uncharacterized protein n=1 Tax=Trapa natans TaxID=22666 RepID=A0AAN7KMQ5_TRANT|nr:hypothetical protein SAY86_027794 [Trapa natans]
MAPNPRVKAAFAAMKSLGIPEDRVKPALKKLLQIYEKNWELIEEESYSVLVDAIFEYDNIKMVDEKRKSHLEEEEHEAQEQEFQCPLKRLRHRNQENEPIASSCNPTLHIGGAALIQPKQEEFHHQLVQNECNKGKMPDMPNEVSQNKGENQSEAKDKGVIFGGPSKGVCIKETNFDSGAICLPKNGLPVSNQVALTKPEDEPFTGEVPLDENPIVLVLPGKEKIAGEDRDVPTSSHLHGEDTECLKGSGIGCNDPGDRTINFGEMQDMLHKPIRENTSNVGPDKENLSVPSITTDICQESTPRIDKDVTNSCACNVENTESVQYDGTGLQGMLFPHCEAPSNVHYSPLKGDDISSGEERANISWVNEMNSVAPPSFRYTPQNLVFKDASVRFTFAQINDGGCCPSCSGDCLSSTIPCACAYANDGEFAYSIRGLVKESFLDECIALVREPKRRSHFHCQECPLERLKGHPLKTCNGHLKRKFIKECWRKCGCSKQCGNRVVQRGISCSLQVFMTSEGKGWGLRTLNDLPKGAFVCEFIGEILTNIEVNERNVNTVEGGKMYQVILDSGWDTASVMDDEALCLDATHYANIVRFINHRYSCF